MIRFCQPFFCEGVRHYVQKEVQHPFHLMFSEFVIQSVIDRKADPLFMKCIPDGCVTVLFIKSAGTYKIELIGTPLSAKALIVYPDALYFAVRLEPGLSFPYSRISNAKISTRDITDTEIFLPLLSGDMQELTEKLFSAPSFEERINIFNSYISLFDRSELLAKEHLCDMLMQIYNAKGNVEISNIADKVCYSERHFSRIFSESLGYSPKTFARIVRFQHVLFQILMNGNVNISDMIASLNYSDQAHFQREFKEFTTLTPRQFIQFAKKNTSRERCLTCTGHCGKCHE